jgi:hypothetical protein
MSLAGKLIAFGFSDPHYAAAKLMHGDAERAL